MTSKLLSTLPIVVNSSQLDLQRSVGENRVPKLESTNNISQNR